MVFDYAGVSRPFENPPCTKQTYSYPLAISVTYLPITILRWITSVRGKDFTPSLAWIFFGTSLLSLSGFINVVLLLSTRPESGLFGQLMFRHPATLLPSLTSEPPALQGAERQSPETPELSP